MLDWSLDLKQRLVKEFERRRLIDVAQAPEQHLIRIVEDDSPPGPDERLVSHISVGERTIRVYDRRPPRNQSASQVPHFWLPDNGRGDSTSDAG